VKKKKKKKKEKKEKKEKEKEEKEKIMPSTTPPPYFVLCSRIY